MLTLTIILERNQGQLTDIIGSGGMIWTCDLRVTILKVQTELQFDVSVLFSAQ